MTKKPDSKDNDDDYQSRLNVGLQTGDTPYDEVVAFTERILNKNFESMFNMHMRAMKNISFNHPRIGKINIEIEAPRIIIPSEKDQAYAKDVYYLLRFKSGRIDTGLGDTVEDMAGWELAFPIRLGTEEVKPDQGTNQQVKVDGKDEKVCSIAGIVYKFPGDYSVERLFAQLSTAEWGRVNEKISRIRGKEGWTSLTKYISESPGNSSVWDSLSTALKHWGRKQQDAGRSTLNVAFKVPKKRYEEKEPTYAPTHLYQQTYPHIDIESGEPSKTSADGNGYNALLWCEMVANNPPPETQQLPWRGNFVIPKRDYEGGEAIEGTFALGYQHFLEGHLLKRLQRLNQISQVTNLSQTRLYNGRLFVTRSNYDIGNKLPYYDDIFKFKRVETKVDAKSPVITYEWERREEAKDKQHTWDDGKTSSTTDHYSETKVTVSWKNGSNKLNITGTSDYVYDNTVYPSQSRVYKERMSRLKYHDRMKWALDLAITGVENGQMKIDIRTPEPKSGIPANLTVDTIDLIQERAKAPEGQHETIRKWWLDNMKTALDTIEKELDKGFDSSAKFVYPGNGVLTYRDPTINRWGNILTIIEHKALGPKKPGDDDYVTVLAPLAKERDITDDFKPQSRTNSEGIPGPICKMTWKLTPTTVVTKSKRVKFVLCGRNDTKAPIDMYYIQIRFTSGDQGPQLFGHEVINGIQSRLFEGRPLPQPTPNSEADETPPASPPRSRKHQNLGSVWPFEEESSGKEVSDAQRKRELADGRRDDVAHSARSANPDDVKQEAQVAAGTITQTCSPATMQVQPMRLNSLGQTKNGSRWWQISTEAPGALSGFVIGVDESITYELEMDVGPPGEPIVAIQENWNMPADPDGDSDGPKDSDHLLIQVSVSSQ